MASETVSVNTSLNVQNVKSTMKRHGYFGAEQLSSTLQGSIWSSTDPQSKQQIVIKTTNKQLHSESIVILNKKRHHVDENILKERAFLKYLTRKTSPKSIVKYIDFFHDQDNYYLVMEHGGAMLFHFVVAIHDRIKHNIVSISEWHCLCRLLFKQMINAIGYMHSNCVAHFDISLENMLINDVYIGIHPQHKQQCIFMKDDPLHPIQIKLCDLGLSEWFQTDDDKCNKYCGKTIYKSPEINARKERFSAYANDVWCLGVTLFMMIFGTCPWKRAQLDDDNFKLIMDGNIMDVVKKWGMDGYVTDEIIDLLSRIFKYEEQRISISDLKQHRWLS